MKKDGNKYGDPDVADCIASNNLSRMPFASREPHKKKYAWEKQNDN